MDGSAVAAEALIRPSKESLRVVICRLWEVFSSTSRYLKVKCLTSAFTGLSIGSLACSWDSRDQHESAACPGVLALRNSALGHRP